MKEARDDKAICDRLQTLTMEGELRWKPMYDQPEPGGLSDRDMEEATRPRGYMLKDSMHGFGVVMVRIENPDTSEIGEPELFLQGQKADVSHQQVGILLDAIQTHLNEIRAGERMSVQDRIDAQVEQAVQPYEEKLAQMQAEKSRLREEKQQMADTLEALAYTATDADIRGESEEQASLLLTPENVRETLRRCFDQQGEVPRAFDSYLDESVVGDVIGEMESERAQSDAVSA